MSSTNATNNNFTQSKELSLTDISFNLKPRENYLLCFYSLPESCRGSPWAKGGYRLREAQKSEVMHAWIRFGAEISQQFVLCWVLCFHDTLEVTLTHLDTPKSNHSPLVVHAIAALPDPS